MKTVKLLEQRADPYFYRHTDGKYYFTAGLSKNLGEVSEGPQPLRLPIVSAGSAGGAGC